VPDELLGIGVLIGALFAGPLIARLGEIAVCAIGLLTFAAAITIAVAPSLPLAFVAMPFSGLGNTLIGVAFTTLLRRRTPDPADRRVSAAADPARRANLAADLREQWRTSSTRKRRWMQSRWDRLGHDHRWLTDLSPGPPSPATSSVIRRAAVDQTPPPAPG